MAATAALCLWFSSCSSKSHDPEEKPSENVEPKAPDGKSGTEVAEGEWNPIEVDFPELTFPSEGGKLVVSTTNYASWVICAGYEYGDFVDGKWVYDKYSIPHNAEGWYSPLEPLDGGWYHAYVPYEESPNQMVVTVYANDTGESRKATIEMECGDAFTRIKIHQEK